MLLDEGGIEGSYLEQEMIGRQPLLDDDDDDDQQHHHHQTSQHQQHLTSIILPNIHHHHKHVGGSTMATKQESFELSILGGNSAGVGANSTSTSNSGDIFRRAPFLASQQQRTASLSTTTTANQQQRQATSGQATAFVNTSFQGDETLRLD